MSTASGELVLVNQRVENAMKKRLQEIALVGIDSLKFDSKTNLEDCEVEIAAFAQCNEGRYIFDLVSLLF
jgi:hypothetical protein